MRRNEGHLLAYLCLVCFCDQFFFSWWWCSVGGRACLCGIAPDSRDRDHPLDAVDAQGDDLGLVDLPERLVFQVLEGLGDDCEQRVLPACGREGDASKESGRRGVCLARTVQGPRLRVEVQPHLELFEQEVPSFAVVFEICIQGLASESLELSVFVEEQGGVCFASVLSSWFFSVDFGCTRNSVPFHIV